MTKPKTQPEITRTFYDIVTRIAKDTGAAYLLDTDLLFNDKFYSWALPCKNEIHFSMLGYDRNFTTQSIVEYKKVIKCIKMPYYVDCAGYNHILTTQPDVYILLHEIAHVITHVVYKGAPVHGEEFCDVYVALIETFEPETISPLGGGFITWGND